MNPSDFQYWQDQYVTAIVNDRTQHHELVKEIKTLTLDKFFALVDRYSFELGQEFPDLDKPEDIETKIYIRLMVLEHLCDGEKVQELCRTSDKLSKHIAWCAQHDMSWLADRVLGTYKPKSQPETQPSKENIMASIEIKTITYINDADVTKLTDEQLIDAIKRIENEIADLGAVKTESSKVKAKIAGLHETLAQVVAILDAR